MAKPVLGAFMLVRLRGQTSEFQPPTLWHAFQYVQAYSEIGSHDSDPQREAINSITGKDRKGRKEPGIIAL